MAVALVGTPTAIADGGSYTAETGSNRACVFVVVCEGSASNRPPDSLTYGTKAATSVIVDLGMTSDYVAVGIFYVLESDVASRSGDVVDATFTGGTPAGGSTIHCYTLSGVHQTTPTGNTDSAAIAASGNSVALVLESVTGGAVIVGAGHRYGGFPLSFATATEHIDESVNANNFRASSGIYFPGSTSYSETVTTESTQYLTAAAASFSPAGAVLYDPIRLRARV